MSNIIIDTVLRVATWPPSTIRLSKPDTDRIGVVLWISYDAWVTTLDPNAPQGVQALGYSRPADTYHFVPDQYSETEWEQIMSEAGWYLGAGYMFRWWHSPRNMPHLFGMERYTIGDEESATGAADDVLAEVARQHGCWEWEINSAWRRTDVRFRWREEDPSRSEDGRREGQFPGWDSSHPWMRSKDAQMDYESHYYFVAPPNYNKDADVLVRGLPERISQQAEMTVADATVYAISLGNKLTERGLRKACESGYVPGARRIGRDWIVPSQGLTAYLDNRPKPGRKPD